MLTAAVLLAVALGAVAQSVGGLGVGLLSGPLLVVALGPHDGVRLVVLLSLVLNAVLLVRLRADVDARTGLLLLVPTLLATPLVARLLRDLPDRPAAALAGAAVVLGAALLAVGGRWAAAGGRTGMLVAALVASVTNVVSGVAGPPLVLWAANAGWPPDRAVATLQVFFLGNNAVALAALGLPDVGGGLVAGCLAALAAGAALGRLVARRLEAAAARRVTLALAAAGGGGILAGAAFG